MKKKQVTLRSGEVLNIPEVADGAICPVCGFHHRGEPAYDLYQTVLPDGSLSESFGAASFQTCPSCNVEYGNDDQSDDRSVSSMWEQLRLAWLNRVGWNDQALGQLQ